MIILFLGLIVHFSVSVILLKVIIVLAHINTGLTGEVTFFFIFIMFVRSTLLMILKLLKLLLLLVCHEFI